MALSLTFAQPFELPNGLTVQTLYVRLVQLQYFRQQRVSDVGTGLANYLVDYYVKPDAQAALELPGNVLPRAFADCGELVEVPSSGEGVPPGHAYAGLSAAIFNQDGGYSRGYAYVAVALQAAFPDASLAQT